MYKKLNFLFVLLMKTNVLPSKVRYFSKIEEISLNALTAQMAQNCKFVLWIQELIYICIIYLSRTMYYKAESKNVVSLSCYFSFISTDR